MKTGRGALIGHVRGGSPAERSGLRTGDVLIAIDGREIADVIDYMFYRDELPFRMTLLRGKRELSVEGDTSGIELEHFRVRTCRNKCLFCFVSQLPRGMRKSLYVKDEDYRMSFLYGNYITMTNLSAEDRKRIAAQRLGPLYVSVHTTDPALRRRMLGNERASDIMGELRFLRENRIRVHTQIVLCPGINDGKELKRTISDLYSFYPSVSSIAVVPVGLTCHRGAQPPLKPVQSVDAEGALEIVRAFQEKFKKKRGDPIVFGADELYIKARRPFPPLKDYGDLPQIENGVGMVPSFISRSGGLKTRPSRGKYITFTGVSFYPFLKKFLERLNKKSISVEAVPVGNSFFGKSVTVAGLLTGGDVIRALSGKTRGYDSLLVPDVVLREGRSVFLDGVTVRDVQRALKIKARVIESAPEGLCSL